MLAIGVFHTKYSALYVTIVGLAFISFSCSNTPVTTVTETPVPTSTLAPRDTLTPIPTATGQPTPTLIPTVDETANAKQCAAVPDGLIGWWPGNNTTQDMVTGNNGTLNGGAFFEAGKVGQAFSFNGIDGSLDIPRAANLILGRQVSLEFWMKPAEDNRMDQCCQGLVNTDYYLVELSGGYTGKVGVNVAINTGGIYHHTSDKTNTGYKVPPGQWTFVVGTYDGKSLKLYINGKVEMQISQQGSIEHMLPGSFLSIGSEDGRTGCPDCPDNRYFKGLIDEVSIYKRALTDVEIQSIYSAGEAGKCNLQN